MSKCACVMVDERTAQYELPGMYYNGTVSVTHKLEDSSVWLYEDPGRNPEEYSLWCTNNDRNTKTYQYPALLFVGNPGNDSDTNPIFWILRGYQPANQTEHLDDDDEPYVDVRQRWIHLRSSDFVVKDESEEGRSRGQYRYLETDATEVYRQTSVYWRTNITDYSEDESSFSARATYEHEPILTQESEEGLRRTHWGYEENSQNTRTSQYVTLSDVYDVAHQAIEGATMYAPPSGIGEGEADASYYATTPTIWIPLGTVAEMSGIGSETASFKLTREDWERVRPYVSGQSASCLDSSDQTQFEWSEFAHMEVDTLALNLDEADGIWNLTLSRLSLLFEGSLVRENSTDIESFEDNGMPVFGAQYERAPRGEEETWAPPAEDEANGAVHFVALPLVLYMSSIQVLVGTVAWI